MATEIGEFVVGAYLKLKEKCDIVDYNVRPPGGGMAGLGELDVIGLRFSDGTAYLCEVATHLQGLEYGKGYADSADRVAKKYDRQRKHAERHLERFPNCHFMFWSPRVPRGRLLDTLTRIEGLELVVNRDYRSRVEELRGQARKSTTDIGNPFFRALQLLEHLHD